MKYFNFIIVCLIGQFSMTACSNEEEIPDNIKSIVFDSRESVTEIDFDKILDTTFRIVPLATNDECLISNIDRLEIVDGKFYIMDHMSQSVYVFNPDGSYAGKMKPAGIFKYFFPVKVLRAGLGKDRTLPVINHL